MYNNLLSLIRPSKRIVVFLSEDIAQKSGVVDYRKPHGHEDEPWQGIDNSRLLTFDFLLANPVLFYNWALDVWYNMDKYEPANVHYLIAKLQKIGFNIKVYTEDIASLCKKAKIDNCVELNGNTSAFCLKCGKYFSYNIVSDFVNNGEVPYCDRCGTILKSNVLLDEMRINPKTIRKWSRDFKNSDLCILFGKLSTRKEFEQLIDIVDEGKLVIISEKVSKFDQNSLLKINDIEEVIRFLDTKIK